MVGTKNMDQENEVEHYDVGVIGGGLAGLSLSILLAKQGHSVVLFEKEKYPFHRVCGEYISLESYQFLESLDFNISAYNLPVIKRLIVSSPNGDFVKSDLDLGGFGVSRFFIDNELKKIAISSGVILKEKMRVSTVELIDEVFNVACDNTKFNCKIVAGSFGKRSNLDIKWSRDFIGQKHGKLNNYIGVKYHVRTAFPDDTISLHNFKDGYCGLSKIEDDKYCLCYLTTANNLKENNNSIREMEKNVLSKNPFLKRIFAEAEFIFDNPVTISQISFNKKSQVENHVLMLGDAAGMITPLCGNGMSIALHSSKIAAPLINSFLNKGISRLQMEQEYISKWKESFEKRLSNGRAIQKLFGKESGTNIFIGLVKHFPALITRMIKATHGKEF